METSVNGACHCGAARFALRWPKARAQLNQRLGADPRLCELCEAYEAACTAVEYWLRSEAPEAAARVEEYRALTAATEQDILEALS
jgi:hypothetical protein